MFTNTIKNASFNSRRWLASAAAPKDLKVAVVGAAGGIGQPLALLLKLSPQVGRLSLFDVAPVTPGVGVDLSHITSPAKVTAFTGDSGLAACLEGADIVVVPAGVPRKPGMTRDDLFNINAGIVANIAQTYGKVCPNAMFLIISNPVNSTVPIAATILEQMGVYNPRKLVGVTYLDVLRANTFVSEGYYPGANVPVVGGHAGTTIIPLLSQVGTFTNEARDALTHRIQFGGDEVVQAKAGGGSATLSMAYAGFKFTSNILTALSGTPVKVAGFVDTKGMQNPPCPGVRFFASNIGFDANGVNTAYPLGKLNAFEQKLVEEAKEALISQAAKGVEFAQNYGKK